MQKALRRLLAGPVDFNSSQNKTHHSDSEANDSKDEGKDEQDSKLNSVDPDYNLQYDIDIFPDENGAKKENNLEIEDQLLIDSLADPDTEQVPSDVEGLNSETMSKHRFSFEVLQQSLLSFDRTAPADVIITVLTNEPKNNLNSLVYNFQVRRLILF